MAYCFTSSVKFQGQFLIADGIKGRGYPMGGRLRGRSRAPHHVATAAVFVAGLLLRPKESCLPGACRLSFSRHSQKYPVSVCTSALSSPMDTPNASSTRRISSGGMIPARSRRRRLSRVRICSVKMILSFARPQRSARTLICVGSRFLSWRLVMAAAMTVGLCRLPISFWMISTGRMPPCSDPSTGL